MMLHSSTTNDSQWKLKMLNIERSFCCIQFKGVCAWTSRMWGHTHIHPQTQTTHTHTQSCTHAHTHNFPPSLRLGSLHSWEDLHCLKDILGSTWTSLPVLEVVLFLVQHSEF